MIRAVSPATIVFAAFRIVRQAVPGVVPGFESLPHALLTK